MSVKAISASPRSPARWSAYGFSEQLTALKIARRSTPKDLGGCVAPAARLVKDRRRRSHRGSTLRAVLDESWTGGDETSPQGLRGSVFRASPMSASNCTSVTPSTPTLADERFPPFFLHERVRRRLGTVLGSGVGTDKAVRLVCRLRFDRLIGRPRFQRRNAHSSASHHRTITSYANGRPSARGFICSRRRKRDNLRGGSDEAHQNNLSILDSAGFPGRNVDRLGGSRWRRLPADRGLAIYANVAAAAPAVIAVVSRRAAAGQRRRAALPLRSGGRTHLASPDRPCSRCSRPSWFPRLDRIPRTPRP